MESTQKEIYDLLILVDATYSMSDYLESLQLSLPKVIAISTLTDCFARVGLLAYRDYCDKKLLEWSGWLDPSESDKDSQPDLISLAKSLDPFGGGDYAEATKTGLAKAYEVMRPEATTIILVYTDAPPHSLINGSMTEEWSNLGKEKKALSDPASYGGYGPLFNDWVSASKTLHSGEKKAQVFCILEPSMAWQYVGHYNYLSTITRGACLYLKDSKPLGISEVTVEMLLAWMGVEKAGVTSAPQKLSASLSRYINVSAIKKAKDETDPAADTYFAATKKEADAKKLIMKNITEVQLTTEILKKHLPKKKTPVQDFAKRYNTDEAYKAVAVEHLTKIIKEDVSAVSLNPVFGSLWRAVCNDRNNKARDRLISAFGLQIERIANAEEKARMKTWLEESYDYTADVLEAVESVPKDQRFPCVFLDPTLAFVRPTNEDVDDEDEEDRPITKFRRDELLEIGRSCDYKILRRLGRVLTRLTFAESAEDFPAHIAGSSDEDVPKIPMALASQEYGRKFWRILLHIVVPGTMLAARPSALLAALSIRLGVQPLLKAADTEMLIWKDKWNNLEIPETWNVSCLSLLLDADQEYRQRMSTEGGTTKSKLLKESDRALFKRLVEYKMLELNLNTHLSALIGWTPEKTSVSIGPIVTCRSCKYPRSVSVMAKNGQCGPCSARDYKDEKEKEAYINCRVTKSDDENTQASWVECFNRECRAQYVVYNVEALNVRAKCHYCRVPNLGHAPVLECTQCLNRVIYPEEYRPSNLAKSDFKCYACVSKRTTIVAVETNANKICQETDKSFWLLKNMSNKIADPFNGRSLFHTITASGTADFAKLVTLFPNPSAQLKLKGKLIHNAPDLIKHLQSFISRRRTESVPCSLCFSNFRHTALRPACGRSSCTQRICGGCLQSWYGLNGSGRIINTAALFCPFCRRAPAAKTLHAYGQGIHAVGGLKTAVEERGQWIHAWCVECGHACRYVERVCARGAPAEVKDWECEDCIRYIEAMNSANENAINELLEQQELEDRGIRLPQGRGGNRAQRALRQGYTRHKIGGSRVVIKKCPKCGVDSQKDSGCNHVMCPVRGCGTHWCWECGGAFDELVIYEHMADEHDGMYGYYDN
ncbi:uncharacterized protein BDZ99DRAFT_114835 [Mytilinidion resinicola]|uniref:RBR-type E3 ubiquitin transferase n=1 Tax=Mytilinidion resinicola TaxID=574789 RepID=A0A6A6YAZ6_9PEZI|nr:uncharacterized protein BDZ99DRAFT_114835 [Mytilinidion resinicola]KAF2805184.1 hypothetical protein BDZ99DRAFT_114835 [Mytilinidion resinicola]